ncbi:unnamed protein product [Adineta ricciae]|uniref:Yippee domain-containing protein n=1 Tax=Adineta ricciae TaxID=249248 RepID=A0A813Z4Q7_ADIRI|nr:unnamed protein product [Adineta ricciae]
MNEATASNQYKRCIVTTSRLFAVNLSPKGMYEKKNTEPLQPSTKCQLNHNIDACLDLLRNQLFDIHICSFYYQTIVVATCWTFLSTIRQKMVKTSHRGRSKALGKLFQLYLPAKTHRTYSCLHCRAQLANHDELISKSFQGSQGRAYLFNSVVNVNTSAAEERVLLTGLHEVADIYCECCKTLLGWKYEHAFESSQKYKEGKYIIELVHMIKDNVILLSNSIKLFIFENWRLLTKQFYLNMKRQSQR